MTRIRDRKPDINASVERVMRQVVSDDTKELLEWAKEARAEMSAFHSLAYGECKGGCPTHYIIDGLTKAISKFE